MGLRIIVFGAGKSGTTALYERLYYSACDVHRVRFDGMFEPRTREAIDQFDAGFGIAKLLLERWFRQPDLSFVDNYDKRVLIVRDPRDVIVSRLMWNIAIHGDNAGAEHSREIQKLLAAKQEDPSSVSMLEIFARLEAALGKPMSAATAKWLAYLPSTVIPKLQFARHTIRYEDFIAGQIADLSNYMGFPVREENVVTSKRGFIKRSTQSGAWKDWLLSVDQDFFFNDELLSSLNYDTSRYNGPRSIAPEDSTAYVERLKPIRERNLAATKS